jgi:leucine dehydrogenase
MMLFDHRDFDGHEHVSFFARARLIIAIHRTGSLGTAGGGCRIWPYSDDDAALGDALRLSRAMSYKLALLEIPAGGAKAVVIGDQKSPSLLREIGRAVDRLNGRFIVGEDVGTDPADLAVIAGETRWVTPHAAGADTAEATAHGVFLCLRRAVAERLGRRTLAGVRVAVVGMGRVGFGLARRLREAGARLVVADLDPLKVQKAVRELDASGETPEGILGADADVLAPCALGGILDRRSVERLRVSVIAGSANNQLAEPLVDEALAGRGILYAPDFVVNAGGVLGSPERAERLIEVFDAVLDRAAAGDVTPHRAAEEMARARFASMGGGAL